MAGSQHALTLWSKSQKVSQVVIEGMGMQVDIIVFSLTSMLTCKVAPFHANSSSRTALARMQPTGIQISKNILNNIF